MPDQPPISDQVGTQLLFENDAVRVWDLRLAPGERIGPHRHTTDYLYVVIGEGTLQTIDADGHRRPPEASADGEVQFRSITGEAVHQAENVGATPWRNIVVELKRPTEEHREPEPPLTDRDREDFGDIPGGRGTRG